MKIENVDKYLEVIEKFNSRGLTVRDSALEIKAIGFYNSRNSKRLLEFIVYVRKASILSNSNELATELETLLIAEQTPTSASIGSLQPEQEDRTKKTDFYGTRTKEELMILYVFRFDMLTPKLQAALALKVLPSIFPAKKPEVDSMPFQSKRDGGIAGIDFIDIKPMYQKNTGSGLKASVATPPVIKSRPMRRRPGCQRVPWPKRTARK